MKKIVALLLAVVMVLGLVACGNDNTATETSGATDVATEPADSQATETSTPSADGEIEIALVTDVGNIDDKSFNQGAWEGVVAYADANGKTYDYFRPSEDSTVARVETMKTAISKGAKVVVCPGYLFEDAIWEIQSQYPDVQFLLLDGVPHNADYTDSTQESNVACILYQEEQAGYFAGYAAVKDGYKQLGFIGGIEVPAVQRFGFGFIQGANAAAEELGIAGDVSVKHWYANTFSPDDAIKTKAAGWYTAGTEVIFACGGGIYLSICAAAEEAGKAVIGVDKDQSYDSDTIITSATKGLTSSVEIALTALYNNGGKWDATYAGQVITLGAKDNCVGLPTAESSWKLNTYTVAEYEELFKKVANGEIVVSAETENPTVTIAVDYNA